MYDYDIREDELIALRAVWDAGATPFGNPARRVQYDLAIAAAHNAIAESDFDKKRDPERVMPTNAEEVLANLEELGYLHVYQQPDGDGDDTPFVWLPVFVGWMLDDLKDGLPDVSTIVDDNQSLGMVSVGDLDVAVGCLLEDQTREALIMRVNETCFLNAIEHGLIKQFGAGNRFMLTNKGRDHILYSAMHLIKTMQGDKS